MAHRTSYIVADLYVMPPEDETIQTAPVNLVEPQTVIQTVTLEVIKGSGGIVDTSAP